MFHAPPTRFATNAERLAKHLGLPMSPRKRRGSIGVVGELLAKPGCPEKGSKGWVIEDFKRFAARCRMLEEFEKRAVGFSEIEKENLLAKFCAYLDGDASKWEEEQLRNNGIIPAKNGQLELGKTVEGRESRVEGKNGNIGADTQVRPTSNESGAHGVAALPGALPVTESQKHLATVLAQHFQGQLKIDISEQSISQWKLGRGLPAGTPLPPTKIGHRIDTQAWADWIERHLRPRHGVGITLTGPQGEIVKDVFQLASESDAHRSIDEARKARLELEVLEKKFMPVELHKRHLKTIGVVLNQQIDAQIGGRAAASVLAGLADGGMALSPEMIGKVNEVFRLAADGARGAVAEALRQMQNAE